MASIHTFNGDFDFLSVAAHFRYGAVPAYPTSQDFQAAAVAVSSDLDTYVEAHWHLEAVRERRQRPGCALDDNTIRGINNRVANRLYEHAVRTA
jgi:hypothetical protein